MSYFPRPRDANALEFPRSVGGARQRDRKTEQVRIIRDEIRAKIEQWCDEVCLQTAAT